MRFPSIALTANGGTLSDDVSRLFGSKSYLWSVAGNLTGPVFQFGANKRRVQIAREKHRESVLNYEQCYLQALREVEDALTAVNTYRAQIEAMKTLVRRRARRYGSHAAVPRRTDRLSGRARRRAHAVRSANRLCRCGRQRDEQLRNAIQSSGRGNYHACDGGELTRGSLPSCARRQSPSRRAIRFVMRRQPWLRDIGGQAATRPHVEEPVTAVFDRAVYPVRIVREKHRPGQLLIEVRVLRNRHQTGIIVGQIRKICAYASSRKAAPLRRSHRRDSLPTIHRGQRRPVHRADRPESG